MLLWIRSFQFSFILLLYIFKDRYYKHQFDFQTPDQRISTKLSSYIWDLKDAGTSYKIKWDIVRRAYPYSAVSGRCDLCTAEKYEIIFNPQSATLNSRNELFSACRHKRTLYLVKNKRPPKRWSTSGLVARYNMHIVTLLTVLCQSCYVLWWVRLYTRNFMKLEVRM